MATRGVCIFPGCGKPHRAFGYCSTHYLRLKRHGDVSYKIRAANGEPLAFLYAVQTAGTDECIKWPFATDPVTGYGTMYHEGKHTAAHRVACEIAHGPPPSDAHHACHSCGKGHQGCVNPRHTRWGTPQENSDDRIKHGTSGKGDQNSMAKITNQQAAMIRERLAAGAVGTQLARELGIGYGTICSIKRGAYAP